MGSRGQYGNSRRRCNHGEHGHCDGWRAHGGNRTNLENSGNRWDRRMGSQSMSQVRHDCSTVTFSGAVCHACDSHSHILGCAEESVSVRSSCTNGLDCTSKVESSSNSVRIRTTSLRSQGNRDCRFCSHKQHRHVTFKCRKCRKVFTRCNKCDSSDDICYNDCECKKTENYLRSLMERREEGGQDRFQPIAVANTPSISGPRGTTPR